MNPRHNRGLTEFGEGVRPPKRRVKGKALQRVGQQTNLTNCRNKAKSLVVQRDAGATISTVHHSWSKGIGWPIRSSEDAESSKEGNHNRSQATHSVGRKWGERRFIVIHDCPDTMLLEEDLAEKRWKKLHPGGKDPETVEMEQKKEVLSSPLQNKASRKKWGDIRDKDADIRTSKHQADYQM